MGTAMGNMKPEKPLPKEPYDFGVVLDSVREDLLDELKLDPVLNELEKRNVFRRSVLQELQEKHTTTNNKISELIQLVKDGDFSKYDDFKKCLGASGQDILVEKLEAAERGEYEPVVRNEPRTEEENLFKVLREDLIGYYRKKESTMSVAPLVEQHDADLPKFYVRPPMKAYNKPNAFGQENSNRKTSKEKTNIGSYRELLFKRDEPYRDIYVIADAGMGKTSFAKMLAVTWCEAHASKDRRIRGTLKSLDSETMEKFDFLFLIKIREFETSPRCCLDEMTLDMIRSKLQHESVYTKEFLEKVLCNKQCLIIVDGLDEWIHPEKCRRGEIIPHRRPWPRCTVLTTTRPWKLSTARLSKADIDRQVEISELDENTAHELESRAIEILNENQSQNGQMAASNKTKTVNDFENSMPKQILGHIRYIPFVLLQMICLWFENSPIGHSLCKVYSNIIELTLTRWLVKTDTGYTNPSEENANIDIKCMNDNTHCQCYMPLLLKIGKLAFSTLFNVIQEKSLLFDRNHVLKCLNEEELNQSLDMGLLSQVKDTTSLTEERMQLYFPHKTFHEFFCALFIATHWNNAEAVTISIQQTVFNKCTSVFDILEMSKVFVFVCGLNPEVFSDISCHLATIVRKDQTFIDHRKCVEEKCLYSFVNIMPMEHYQGMHVSCFLECTRNQHHEWKIIIEDMFLDPLRYDKMENDEKQALEKILSNSATSMRSLTLEGFYEREEFPSGLPERKIIRTLEQTEFPCLESLIVERCKSTLLQSVLSTTVDKLKYLQLGDISLTADGFSAISRLNNLRGLYLDFVHLSRNCLSAISDFIKGCISLQKLRLDFKYESSDTDEKTEEREASINCLLRSIEANTMLTFLKMDVDVGQQNCVLDLSKHDKLHKLHLRLPLTELHINTEHLAECEVNGMHESSAVSSLLAELLGAPVLHTLRLEHITSSPPIFDITALPELSVFTLSNCVLRDCTVTINLPGLTKCTLEHCNFSGSTVTLIPEMTSLETIALCDNKMSMSCWRELFLSISKLPQPIIVELTDIKMTVRKWKELLFDILGKLPKSIHAELISCKGLFGEEWIHIFDDMKASNVFCVTSTSLDLSEAFISFDTVVV